MVREIKDKNLFQLARQSAKEIGYRTLSAYGLMAVLFVTITITFVLTRYRQDIRQRAETVYLNCDVAPFITDSEELQLLSLINSYRQNNGLKTLTLSSYLNRAAEWKANDMSKYNYFSHTDSTGRDGPTLILNCGYLAAARGENLAENSNGNANAALNSWKKSPSHDDILLGGLNDPQYNWSKIGIARAYNASVKAYFWATEFGYADDGTNGAYIPSSTAPTPTPLIVVAPGPTSQTTCANLDPGSITFNWTQQQSNMCYQIYYTYSGGSQTVNGGCNISSFTQTGFSLGLIISWQVRAYSGSNIGPYTTAQTITVPSSCNSVTATPTPTKAPTPTPTLAMTQCPGGTTNCANSTPSNYYSCSGTPNYLGNTNYNNWCYTYAGGANAYCYSCIAPTPTPVSSAPHLQLWNAYCSNGSATIAFNWTGTNPYGYTLQWGSPRLYNYTQTVTYATSGIYYSGFSSNVNVEYQVWANNSSGLATTPSDNGSFIQTTPSCAVSIPTPTPYTASSCPSYDPATGYNNICTTNPCPGGSMLYSSGTGNAACAAYYGSTYGTCCMVNQPNGCPGGSIYTCRQTSCSFGETNLSSGNAACISAYGWHTGYCCY